MNRPSLNLPPDVARQRQMEMQQLNQLYSSAFQAYLTLVPLAYQSGASLDLVADIAIASAKVFRSRVEEDMKRGQGN